MAQNYAKRTIPGAFISEEDLTDLPSTIQRSESAPFLPTIFNDTPPNHKSPRRKKSTPQPKRNNSVSTKRKKVVFPSKSVPLKTEARRKSSTLSVEYPRQQRKDSGEKETTDDEPAQTSPDTNDADESSLSSSPRLTFVHNFTNYSNPYLSAASTRKASYATAESSSSLVSPPSPIRALHRVSTSSSDAGRSLPPLSIWTGSNASSSSLFNSPLSPKLMVTTPSSPKAALADAVTTRVSVSPSKVGSVIRIVESNDGDQDAFWDAQDAQDDLTTLDITQEQKSDPAELRTSSLDAVTAKLTWWSWGRSRAGPKSAPLDPITQTPSAPQPTIGETENPSLAVPPNSARTSQHSSRYPSDHHSQHPSTMKFYDADEQEDQGRDDAKGKVQPTVATSQWSRRKDSSSTSSEDVYRPRLLDDLRFTFHRDSVALARDRLFQTEGIKPEHFARKDSLAVAKARLAAKPKLSHAPPMEEVSESPAVQLFPRNGGDGGSEMDGQDEPTSPRHIRIVEPNKPVH